MGAAGAVTAGVVTAYVAPGYTAAAAVTAFVGQQVINHFTATKVSDNQVEQTRIEASARVGQTEIKRTRQRFSSSDGSRGYRGIWRQGQEFGIR
jgi:hypothetical protein